VLATERTLFDEVIFYGRLSVECGDRETTIIVGEKLMQASCRYCNESEKRFCIGKLEYWTDLDET